MADLDRLQINALVRELRQRVPLDAAEMLAQQAPAVIEQALRQLPADFAARIAAQLPGTLAPESPDVKLPGQVAELMEPPRGVLHPDTTVSEASNFLRHAENPSEITYLYVVDAAHKLLGLVVMRDLLIAQPDQTLSEVMLSNPFRLKPEMPVGEAVKATIKRHYPVYPVCDADGRLVGIVRGWRVFERQAVEITAQSGSMVGLNKEERVYTPLLPALYQRHPWLQLNLFTAFCSAFVVSTFSETIERVVVLAAFLPVLSCLAGNNGCQTLAITLRGLTLGDFEDHPVRGLLYKELLLGALNGLGAGVVCAAALYGFAVYTGTPNPRELALVMLLSMVIACVASCLLGMLVPLLLKRFGADPATASSIFVLTITDVVGMGVMLSLTTLLVL